MQSWASCIYINLTVCTLVARWKKSDIDWDQSMSPCYNKSNTYWMSQLFSCIYLAEAPWSQSNYSGHDLVAPFPALRELPILKRGAYQRKTHNAQVTLIAKGATSWVTWTSRSNLLKILPSWLDSGFSKTNFVSQKLSSISITGTSS